MNHSFGTSPSKSYIGSPINKKLFEDEFNTEAIISPPPTMSIREDPLYSPNGSYQKSLRLEDFDPDMPQKPRSPYLSRSQEPSSIAASPFSTPFSTASQPSFTYDLPSTPSLLTASSVPEFKRPYPINRMATPRKIIRNLTQRPVEDSPRRLIQNLTVVTPDVKTAPLASFKMPERPSSAVAATPSTPIITPPVASPTKTLLADKPLSETQPVQSSPGLLSPTRNSLIGQDLDSRVKEAVNLLEEYSKKLESREIGDKELQDKLQRMISEYEKQVQYRVHLKQGLEQVMNETEQERVKIEELERLISQSEETAANFDTEINDLQREIEGFHAKLSAKDEQTSKTSVNLPAYLTQVVIFLVVILFVIFISLWINPPDYHSFRYPT